MKGDGSVPPGMRPQRTGQILDPFANLRGVSPQAIDRNVILLTPKQAMATEGIKGTYAAELAGMLAGERVKFEVSGSERMPTMGLAIISGDQRVELPISVAEGISYKGGAKYAFGREVRTAGAEPLTVGKAILERTRELIGRSSAAPLPERMKAMKTAVDRSMEMTSQHMALSPLNTPGGIQHYLSQHISYGRKHPLFEAYGKVAQASGKLAFTTPGVKGAGRTTHSTWSKGLEDAIQALYGFERTVRGLEGSRELRDDMGRRHGRSAQGLKSIAAGAASRTGQELDLARGQLMDTAQRIIVPTTSMEEFATSFFPDLAKSQHHMRAPGLIFENEMLRTAREERLMPLFHAMSEARYKELFQESLAEETKWMEDGPRVRIRKPGWEAKLRRQAQREIRENFRDEKWTKSFMKRTGIYGALNQKRMRRTGVYVRSAYTGVVEDAMTVHAEHMAIGARRGKMGKVRSGMNMRILALAPAEGLNEAESRIAKRLLGVFGDASAVFGSPMAVGFAGMNQQYSEVFFDLSDGIKGRMNPVLQEMVETVGARGQLDMADPEFKKILKKHGVSGRLTHAEISRTSSDIMEPFAKELQGLKEKGMYALRDEGVLGFNTTSLGELKSKWVDEQGRYVDDAGARRRVSRGQTVARVPSTVGIGKGQHVTGLQMTSGGRVRVVLSEDTSKVVKTRLTTSLLSSTQQRYGGQGVAIPKGVPVDDLFDLIIGNVGGDGTFGGFREDIRLRHAVDRLWKSGGAKNVKKLVESFEELGIKGVGYAPARKDMLPSLTLDKEWLNPANKKEFIGEETLTKAINLASKKTGVDLRVEASLSKISMPQAEAIAEWIGQTEGGLTGHSGSSRPVTGAMIHKLFRGYDTVDTMSLRGGQPVLGKTGSLRIRLDDLRGYTAAIQRAGGKQLQDEVGGWYKQFEKRVYEPSAPWRSYRSAVLSTIGDTGKKSTRHVIARERAEFKKMTLTQFRKKYGTGKGLMDSIGRGSSIEDFRGTPFVKSDPLTGSLTWSDEALRIDITDADVKNLKLEGSRVGRLAFDQSGKTGAEITSVVLPSGRQLEQQGGEAVRLKKHQKYGLALFDTLLNNDSLDRIYTAGNESNIPFWQRLFGKKGALHSKVFKPERSLVANIGSHASVKVGEIGVSIPQLKSMGYSPEEIIRAGGVKQRDLAKVFKDEFEHRGDELLGALDEARKGEQGLFLSLKSEPARDPFHYGAYKVRIIPDKIGEIDTGTRKHLVHSRGVMAMNSLELGVINRDKDYDMLMAFGTSDRRVKGDFLQENAALKKIWAARSKERKAIRNMERFMTAGEMADWKDGYTGSIIHDEVAHIRSASLKGGLLDNIAKQMKVESGSRAYQVLEGTLQSARDQGLVQGVGEFTGLANVRWRQATEIVYDVMQGRGGADKWTEFGFRNEGALRNQHVQAALTQLDKRKKDLGYLLDVAKASEYAVLKKGATREMFTGGAVGAVHMADPFLHGMMVAAGQAGVGKPGSKAAIKNLGDAFFETMTGYSAEDIRSGVPMDKVGRITGGGAQGNPLTIAAYTEYTSKIDSAFGQSHEAGITALRRYEMKIAQRTAEVAQPLAFLMHGAIDGGNIGMQSSFEMLRQQNPNYNRGKSFEQASIMSWGRKHNAESVNAEAWLGELARIEEQARRSGAGHVADDAIRKGFMESISPGVQRAADAGERAFRKIWGSKAGKAGLAVGGAVTAWHLLGNTFRGEADSYSSPGDGSTPGAQMPPHALMDQPAEGNIDYSLLSDTRNAYVERTPSVRTHLQVDGQSPGMDYAFMEMANDAFGTLGIQPTHTGTVINDHQAPLYNHQVDAAINDRSRSRF